MKDQLELAGVVLQAQPYKEFDKRLVILTRERGLVTAFARGARRQSSPLLASANPFVFGHFALYEGKNAYTLVGVNVTDYFAELPHCQPGVYYGFYFLELAMYFGREGLEAEETVNLIYVTLRALAKGVQSPELIRRIFEIRLLTENGLYALPPDKGSLDESAYYALAFVSSAPISRLYSFSLSEKAMADFAKEAEKHRRKQVDIPLKSLPLIDEKNSFLYTFDEYRADPEKGDKHNGKDNG